jgi:glyoxylase I family protein
VWTPEQILELLATETFQPPQMKDFQCLRVADGVALVTYRAVRTDPGTGAQSATLRSSLWTKETGRWRVLFHQGTAEAYSS